MDKAKIVCANNLLKGFYYALNSTLDAGIFAENIIVVPDKFSLSLQKMYFEKLGVESSFSTNITTLTRLIKLVGLKTDKELVSKNIGTMLISKILLDNKQKLGLIKMTELPTLSRELYETILQLKSSGIGPEELNTKSNNLNVVLKLEDIKFVYGEYEKMLLDKMLDNADMLELFCNAIKENKYFENKNVYFCCFDSFSYRQLECIKTICANSNSFCITLSANTFQNNKHIYLNETLQDILELFKTSHIEYEIENIKYNSGNFEFLNQNLFASVDKKQQNDIFTLVEAENENQEIDYIAREIKKLVTENEKLKFSDINIACSNIENYKSTIENIFNEYDLPFYIDVASNLSEHFFGRMTIAFLKMLNGGMDNNLLFDILKTPCLNNDVNELYALENYVYENGIEKEKLFSKIDDEQIENIRIKYIEPIKVFCEEIKKCKTINNYVALTKKVIEYFDINSIFENIENDNYSIEFKKMSEQVPEKIQNLLDFCEKYFGETNCSSVYYLSMLEDFFESIELKNAPIGVNKIYIGDVNANMFYPSKYLFMVGSCDGLLPYYKNDCGLITDEEIEKLDSKNLLNPTIRFVNKESKYKVFEVLLSSEQKIYVSYPALLNGDPKRPSELFGAIKNICKNKDDSEIELIKISNEISDYLINNKLADKNFIYLLGNKNHARQILRLYGTKNGFLKAIEKIVKIEPKKENQANADYKKLFFAKNSFSVSQIERYFKCPYVHFVDYGLKLQEKKKYGFEKRDVGSFLHNIAEKYVLLLKSKNYKVEQTEIEKLIDSEIKSTKSINAQTKSQLDSLKREAFRLCEYITSQIDSGEFKPQDAELSFTFKDFFDGIDFVGKVDRLDIKDNFFVIYDYKTGKDAFSFDDTYYGNKIQTLLYLDALEKQTDKIGIGSFYIPVRNKFKNSEELEKISGVFLDQKDIIKMLDGTIEKDGESEFFKISYKKDGELSSTVAKVALSPLEMKAIKEYVVELVKNGLMEIKNGNIAPSPLENACEYCKYRGMCGFEVKKKGYRKHKYEVDKQTFCKEELWQEKK